MYRSILFALVLFALVLSACSPAASPFPEIGGLSSKEGWSLDAAMEPPSADYARSPEEAGEGSVSQERIVIKEATLEIVVKDPPQTLNMITKLADEMGGYVVNANLHQTRTISGEEHPRASITIRVPSSMFDEALGLIEAESDRLPVRNVNSQDVTSEYRDLQSRLRNQEAAENQLIRIMESASKTEDVLNVHRELTNIREQIELIKGKIQFYEQSSQLSAIRVEIIPKESVLPVTIAGWQPVGVVRDAVQSLVNTLQFLATTLIWIVIYLIPVLLVIFLPFYVIARLLFRWHTQRKSKPGTQSTS